MRGPCVVARHVQTLRHWQEERWGEIVWGENCTDEEDRDRFFTELKETRTGLRILALAGQVKPAVHEELHRSLDQLELLYQNMDETPEQFDQGFTWAPGLGEWLEMVELAANLLNPGNDLQLWSELGALLGGCRRYLGDATVAGKDCAPRSLKSFAAVTEELRSTGRWPFLDEALRVASTVSSPRAKGS